MANDDRPELKVITIRAANVTKTCMVCGGRVRTAKHRLPLCIICRDQGLRTTDDLLDLEEAWQQKTQSPKS